MSKLQPASINPLEVEKFSKIADEWWSLDGKFKPLHRLNPVRIEYILKTAKNFLHKDTLSGLDILDIGCGGGLLCEPMCKYGANVTGIDASAKNIQVASLHAQKSDLDIDYICTSAEELAATGVQFDIVLNMEVIEHVADVASFMEASCKLVKPGGIMIIATLNRTIKSFALAIVGAEYILGWLPRGTHNWEKFLKPSQINAHLEKNQMSLKEMKGVSLNALKNEWHISEDIAVNYMMCAVK